MSDSCHYLEVTTDLSTLKKLLITVKNPCMYISNMFHCFYTKCTINQNNRFLLFPSLLYKKIKNSSAGLIFKVKTTLVFYQNLFSAFNFFLNSYNKTRDIHTSHRVPTSKK